MNNNNKSNYIITTPDAFGRVFVLRGNINNHYNTNNNVIIEYKQGDYISYNTDLFNCGRVVALQYTKALQYITATYNDDILQYKNHKPFVALYNQLKSKVARLQQCNNSASYEQHLKNYIHNNGLLFAKDGFGSIIATNYTKDHVLES